MKEVTADAALFLPDRIEQGSNRLGQFFPFSGRHLHIYVDHEHILYIARSMPTGRIGWQEKRKAFINRGLEETAGTGKKTGRVCQASIYSGTSLY